MKCFQNNVTLFFWIKLGTNDVHNMIVSPNGLIFCQIVI